MIKPKRSFGKKEFEVNEEFIDREEAKKIYRDKLNSNKKNYNILVYYGVGGIGKSKLRKEICRIHEKESAESIIMYLDLNAAGDRNLGAGILKLVDSCNAKIDFKCFELAYALYFRKKYPSTSYGREKGYISENTFIGIGLNIIGILDGGITSTAAEIVEKAIRTISNRVISKEVKEELQHFDEYSINEMEEWLPAFFEYDLSCYLKKHSSASTLIVFDTFEALNENIIEQVHRSKNERWIQDIIKCFSGEEFPNLLFAIFGRDKIEWDAEWMEYIEQYPLKEFEDIYSMEYLKKAGIEEKEIVDSIIKSSQGYPFLLYLSLETYANIINSGDLPSKDYFGGGYPEIIERFVYNLDKDTVEVLRLMSIPNFYYSEIFGDLIKYFNIPFPMTKFEQFNKYSFVTFESKEKKYYLHNLMRKEILKKTDNSLVSDVHKFMLSLYAKKFLAKKDTENLIELIYHARNALTCAEFNLWLKSPLCEDAPVETPLLILKNFQEKGEQEVLIQIIGGVLNSFSLNEIIIELVNIYIDIVHLGGDYETAVSICEQYLSQFNENQIINDEQLIKMKIRKIHHCMFYTPVRQLIEDAEGILESSSIEQFPEVYNELLFLLGGNLGILEGDYEYCKNWLEKSMSYAKMNSLDSFVQRTIRKEADILIAEDRIDEALCLINQSVSIESDIDTRYKIYLMGVLGEAYRKQGNLESAMKCYEIIEKKSTENSLPGWRAHSYLAQGLVEMGSVNFQEASDLLIKAESIYQQINHAWGKINTRTAKILLMSLCNEENVIIEAKKCREEATKMNYRYNVNFLDSFINGENGYFQLFFL